MGAASQQVQQEQQQQQQQEQQDQQQRQEQEQQQHLERRRKFSRPLKEVQPASLKPAGSNAGPPCNGPVVEDAPKIRCVPCLVMASAKRGHQATHNACGCATARCSVST